MWLVIPLRSLARGKSRLGEVLDGDERRRLNARFLDHLLHEAAGWPGLPSTVVVSGCDEVLARARRAGARTLRQAPAAPGDEADSRALNAGLEQARRALVGWGPPRALMVVSCDLPLVRAGDLRRVAAEARQAPGGPHVVIAPDRAGIGTNALYLPAGAPLPFCFGPGSAGRHVEAARRLGWPALLLGVPGLAFDIDTPADYARWQRQEEMAS